MQYHGADREMSAMEAADLKVWCEEQQNFAVLKQAFESTTSFGKLQACNPTVAGKNVYLRLVCFSGDAMGMNMVSKGSLAVIETLQAKFPSLELVALSGNMCTDKKAAATNWLHGRGKSVVVEAVIPKDVVRGTLKTTVDALIHTNTNKNLIGSAMAALIAEGTSTIQGVPYLERGYERVDEKLRSLGADVQRIEINAQSLKDIDRTLTKVQKGKQVQVEHVSV